MENKEKYRQLCKVEKTIPIFSRDWWMDAVCGEDKWDVILFEKDDYIIAAMPYFIKERFRFKYITQPKLTPTNGIWIKYPEHQTYRKQLSYEKEMMQGIINQLSLVNIDYFQQSFHYSVTNWQPFYWRGFKQTTGYTYVIEDLSNLDRVFSNFSKSNRKIIRKAEKIARVYSSDDIEQFYEMNKKVYDRQGLSIPYSLGFLSTVDKACVKNNCRKILVAEDEKRQIHSTVYIVWDSNSAYLLMSGTDPKFRYSNYKTLLVWEAIKFASTVTKKFDFEGSMVEPIAEYFRKFGGVQKPYFNISKNISNSIIFDISKKIYFKIRKAN